MTTDRRGSSSVISYRSENAPPVTAIAGEVPDKRAHSFRLLFKQLRVIEIDKQSHQPAVFRCQPIEKIEDAVYVGIWLRDDLLRRLALGKKIRNRLPKYSSAQPCLVRPLGMDLMMHDNFGAIDSVMP